MRRVRIEIGKTPPVCQIVDDATGEPLTDVTGFTLEADVGDPMYRVTLRRSEIAEAVLDEPLVLVDLRT